MNTPLVAPQVSTQIPDTIKKKRVLLIDSSHASRELRAEVMRKLGIDVDSAADIAEARAWWRPALYDLVLVNMEKGRGQRDRFCDGVRNATPPQRVLFLVGHPEYLAKSPCEDQGFAVESSEDEHTTGISKRAASLHPRETTPRWGIMEASRQISAVRSASIARTQAMRAIPPPPRDLEGQRDTLLPTPTSLDNLLKEELR